ncbi:elongation factor [Cyclospora cayetanensis]|uniref:Elongation factor n=1 Tax=Cyclospora cayetanensis TaxID=88456 RepID=A0A1D3D371_9EIME|nr:elongation factor [Cyclospora cayetanensis]
MYVDTSNGAVVMADEKFDEARLFFPLLSLKASRQFAARLVTIPLRLFGGPAVAEHLTPEMQLAVWMHEGEPIKVQLPPSVLTVLREVGSPKNFEFYKPPPKSPLSEPPTPRYARVL